MNVTVWNRAGVRIALLFIVALVAAPVAQDRLAQDLD